MYKSPLINKLLTSEGELFIQNCYYSLLLREPDQEGLQVYLRHLSSGLSKEEVIIALVKSPEGQTNNFIDIKDMRQLQKRIRLRSLIFRLKSRIGFRLKPNIKSSCEYLEEQDIIFVYQLFLDRDPTLGEIHRFSSEGYSLENLMISISQTEEFSNINQELFNHESII